MRLLFGLGNPGEKYIGTRHNAGFWTVNAVAESLGAEQFKEAHDCKLVKISLHGETHILAKPQTFMNASGRPLAALLAYYKLSLEDVLVAADDVYIKPGSAKVRASGGDAGHNGWRSVLSSVGGEGFQRLRIGVGVYPQRLDERVNTPELEDYVLSKPSAADRKRVDAVIDFLTPNLVAWLTTGERLEEGTFTAP